MAEKESKNSSSRSIVGVNLRGKCVVLKKRSNVDSFQDVHWLVVRCNSGFGCSPIAVGQALYITFLADGEDARYSRGSVDRLATQEEIEIAVNYRKESGLL